MVEDFTKFTLKKREEERKSLFLLKLMPIIFNSGLISNPTQEKISLELQKFG
jgi:hypothetical protein